MKQKILSFLSIISTLSVVTLLVLDFYGGFFIYLLSYTWVFIPLLIIYVITGILTLISLFNLGIKRNTSALFIYSIGIICIVLFTFYHSELFRSKIILDATLHDDLSNINIKLRENGKFSSTTSGMFGYVDRISGRYIYKNDTIIFLDKPYSNDFIPDTVIIDKADSAIYFNREKNGEFKRKKTFVNYFEIYKNEL